MSGSGFGLSSDGSSAALETISTNVSSAQCSVRMPMQVLVQVLVLVLVLLLLPVAGKVLLPFF